MKVRVFSECFKINNMPNVAVQTDIGSKQTGYYTFALNLIDDCSMRYRDKFNLVKFLRRKLNDYIIWCLHVPYIRTGHVRQVKRFILKQLAVRGVRCKKRTHHNHHLICNNAVLNLLTIVEKLLRNP